MREAGLDPAQQLSVRGGAQGLPAGVASPARRRRVAAVARPRRRHGAGHRRARRALAGGERADRRRPRGGEGADRPAGRARLDAADAGDPRRPRPGRARAARRWRGGDPVNAAGETALAEAAYAADEDIGATLLAKGAKPGPLDRYGKSPICYAAARGAAKLVAALLDAGIDVNARYGGDLTALMWASGFSDQTPLAKAAATVQLLIARGAKLDFVDDRGRSALMIAAALNRFESARALIQAGADRGLRDKSGKSAADLAATPEMRALVAP